MDAILQKPLKDINSVEELTELFDVLPEKHVERLVVIDRLAQMRDAAEGAEKKRIVQALQVLKPDRQRDVVISALHVPWGDWSRIYRVRGLFRAVEYLETLIKKGENDPNVLYNLAFLYYIAYSVVRDPAGERIRHYREKALDLACRVEHIYADEQVGRIEHFVTRIGGLILHEWFKNLPEYCTALANNIISLIHLIDRQYDQALMSINRSFEAHPTPPECYFSMGIYFQRKGAFNPAIRMLTESIKKKGEHSAEAYYQLGRVYYQKVVHFSEELERLRSTGQLRRQQKRLVRQIDERIQKALKAFEGALGEDPYFPLPYYWMGLTHLLKRQCSCEPAINLIGLAFSLDPTNIARYLRDFPLRCRSANTGCDRTKVQAMAEQLMCAQLGVGPS